jgi:hypothetical protein
MPKTAAEPIQVGALTARFHVDADGPEAVRPSSSAMSPQMHACPPRTATTTSMKPSSG